MSDDVCQTATAHATAAPAPATSTVSHRGVRWRVCDACAQLFNNAETRTKFRTLTVIAEPKPEGMP